MSRLDVGGSPFTLALETLARAARLDVEHVAIERAREGCAVRTFDGSSWPSDLVRVGAVVGLRVRRLDLSLSQILGGVADDLMPLVRLEARTAGDVCLTIHGRTLGRVDVTVGDDPHVRSLDRGALGDLFELPFDAQLEWVTADPSASLGGSPHDHEHEHHPSPLRRLLGLVRLERDDLGVVVVYAVGVGLLSLATPLGVQFIVNTVAFGALLQPLVVLTLLVLAGLALEGLLRALQYWVIERIQQRMFVRVALDVAYRLPRVREGAFDGTHPPELVNRFFDVVTLQKGAATVLSDGVSIVLHSLMGMLILAFYHPFLLGFDVVLVVGIVLIVFVLGRGGAKTAIRESEAKYAIAGWLEDAAQHRGSLALGDGPAFVAARADALTREWLDRRRKHWRIVFRQVSSALVLQSVASAALLGLGGWLVLSRQLTLGQLVAAELIVTGVVSGFAKLGKSFESVYDLVAAADKLGYLLDLELVRAEGGMLPPREHGIDINAHRLDVACGGILVGQNMDLHLRPGSRTVVYGSGGAGKSSLVDVLACVRDPVGGQVIVDGMPAMELASGSLGAAVAIVRDGEVFEGTLFENVAMGRAAVGRKEARDALRAVGLADVVARWPRGLDTPLSTDARALGATGAILLTLARAVAGQPRLLVLDGALDRLGESARRIVWRTVSERSWTVLVTTARRDLVDIAEDAFVLESQCLEKVTRGALRPSRTSIAYAAPAEEA